MTQGRRRQAVWTGFGLVGFCLLAGSRWLVGEMVLPSMPASVSAGLHSCVVSLVFLLFVAADWKNAKKAKRLLRQSLLWVAGLFVLPGAIALGASGAVPSLTLTLVPLLAPVAIVLLCAQQARGFGEGNRLESLLVPSVGGLAGAYLIVPASLPSLSAGWVWFGAAIGATLLAAVSAVRLHQTLRGAPLAFVGMVASGLAVVPYGLASMYNDQGFAGVSSSAIWLEVGSAGLVDAPLLGLSLWLLQRMHSVQFSSRYVIVLLITLTESAVLMHARLNWTTGAGALMMLASGVWLSGLRPAGGEVSLSLRG